MQKRSILLILATLVLATVCIGQPPPASSNDSRTSPSAVGQLRSLRDLGANEQFSSVDGRFSISLPKSISGFASLTPASMGENVSGGQFSWRLKEGDMIAAYYDYLSPTFQVNNEKDFADFFGGSKNGMLDKLGAKLTSEANFKLGEYRGQKYVFELPNGVRVLARVIYVEKRSYTLLASISDSVADAEALLSRALDTFVLIPKSKIEADMLRSIEASTPTLLPQSPIVSKERSDAEDQFLKGNVKTVTVEDQDLSGTWTSQIRHFSYIEEFNEKGNRIKRISFDSKGNPYEITVFGYLDGARVSKSNSIRYEYDPPPMRGSGGSVKAEAKPRDDRISYRYSYKFKDGKLAEMQMYYNDGTPGMRYTYTYVGNIMEKLAFDDKGKLNQKYIHTLDENGNSVAETNVDVFQSRPEGDRRYKITYDSFDQMGNWTKKTETKIVMENGKEVLKPAFVSFRTITYFQ